MLLNVLWLSLGAYLILQVVVLWRSPAGRRLVAGLPLIVMLPVLGYCVVGLIQNSNLWPLLLLLTSPVAFLYVVVIAFTIRRPTPQSPAAKDAAPQPLVFII